MAAFDPATIQLQRDLLDKTSRQLDSDRRQLTRLPKNSRSKMAERLRARVVSNTAIAGDLAALIRFMESLNREHVDYAEAEAVREIREEMALEAAGVESWEEL